MIVLCTPRNLKEHAPKKGLARRRLPGCSNLAGLLLALISLSVVSVAWAANQGTLGPNSTGTSDISVTIPEQFRISSLQDVSFGTWNGGDLSSHQNTCVYHNGDGSYSITATSSTGSFALQKGPDYIPFEVYFNNTPTPTGGSALAYNSATPASGSNTTTPDCSAGGLSANIRVRIAEASLQAAKAGAYNATLSFIIQAD